MVYYVPWFKQRRINKFVRKKLPRKLFVISSICDKFYYFKICADFVIQDIKKQFQYE